MKKLFDRQRRDLTAAGLALLVILACAARLVLAAQGRLYLEPENSPIDDQLMYNAAVSITNGQWLGPYAYNTIAKHMFFSVWLAFVHWLGAPYLLANAALALTGAWVMASALAPVLKKRLWVLAAFVMLAFCPVGFDRCNARIYRDSITVSLLLLAFGGMIGAVLRAMPAEKEAHPRRRCAARWGYAVIGGLGLGASWLNREDGVWLLPFCVCFAVLGAVLVVKAQGLRRSTSALASFCLPFVLLAGCLAAYAGMNNAYYGRFLISDLTSRDFTTAYGLLTGIEDENTGACRPITRATRQVLYDNSDFFAALEPYWESPVVLGGYGSKDAGEYGGSFYYGMRLANQLAGQYRDAAETKAFYEEMAAELRRLEAQGVIRITHFHATTVPYWRGEYLLPTLKELGSELKMALFLPTFEPRTPISVYSRQELVDEMRQYLHGDIVRGYQEGTDLPYFNPKAYALEQALCWLWRCFAAVGTVAGLWLAFARFRQGFAALFGRRRPVELPEVCRWVLVWGLGLSALMRCALMSYMEVTVFHIGTYLMYLSTASPLFGLAGLLGLQALLQARTARR